MGGGPPGWDFGGSESRDQALHLCVLCDFAGPEWIPFPREFKYNYSYSSTKYRTNSSRFLDFRFRLY